MSDLKTKIALIIETDLLSLIRSTYKDNDGVNLRLESAVQKIADLIAPKETIRRKGRPPRENVATNIIDHAEKVEVGLGENDE